MTRTRTSDDRAITTGTRIVSDTESSREPIDAAAIVAAQRVETSQRSFLRGTGLRIRTNSIDLFGDLVVLYTPAVRVTGSPIEPVISGPISGVPINQV